MKSYLILPETGNQERQKREFFLTPEKIEVLQRQFSLSSKFPFIEIGTISKASAIARRRRVSSSSSNDLLLRSFGTGGESEEEDEEEKRCEGGSRRRRKQKNEE